MSKAPANWMQDEYATGQLIAQLRADLATVTAEWKLERAARDDISGELHAERAAHAATRKALEGCNAESASVVTRLRAELAKAEARVKTFTSPLVQSVGQCSHCGERGPLMSGARLPSHKLKLICVYGWGCSAVEALRNG